MILDSADAVKLGLKSCLDFQTLLIGATFQIILFKKMEELSIKMWYKATG
jgi:hypothetical protein